MLWLAFIRDHYGPEVAGCDRETPSTTGSGDSSEQSEAAAPWSPMSPVDVVVEVRRVRSTPTVVRLWKKYYTQKESKGGKLWNSLLFVFVYGIVDGFPCCHRKRRTSSIVARVMRSIRPI